MRSPRSYAQRLTVKRRRPARGGASVRREWDETWLRVMRRRYPDFIVVPDVDEPDSVDVRERDDDPVDRFRESSSRETNGID